MTHSIKTKRFKAAMDGSVMVGISLDWDYELESRSIGGSMCFRIEDIDDLIKLLRQVQKDDTEEARYKRFMARRHDG